MSTTHTAGSSHARTERIRPFSGPLATILGTRPADARRARVGTAISGRSAATAPGTWATVSGSSAVAIVSATNSAMRMAKTNRVGLGAYWTNTPVVIAPSPRPRVG